MKKLISSLILLAGAVTAFFAQDSSIPKFTGWKQAETEHFKFVYEDASKEAAETFALIADDAWNKIAKTYALPKDKIKIYVTGRTETVNAFTFSAPLEIMMFTTPVITPDFTFREDWAKTFFTHELIHAANMKFEDRKNPMGYLIGEMGNSLEMMNVNLWALEGLTTVLETELTNGGRGRSPYFELYYKAPTLENAFISYSEIGKEEEPPYGQAYVMGYLIMRSIADRFGLETLANIERNRELFGNWEDAVLKVTGVSASEIYKDVKKALVKKYADERKIPEGITISSRNTGTYSYKPAIILEDGTLIALRTAKNSDTAVVKLNPAGKNGSKSIYSTDEEDPESINKETVLFTGAFTGSDAVTADANGKVYSIQYIQHNDKNPGVTIETNLYSWDKENGTKQLTKNYSLYQPSVSRDGSTLVAVHQKGMKMSLVKVNTENGEVTELLADPNLSFMQPSVNKDGTKVTFLAVDDSRAKVAYMKLTDNPDGNYTVIGNNEEQIFDPSYPSWQADDSITYCCNYRGRLEVFEVRGDGPTDYDYDNAEIFTERPMVSDPVAALWAYKTEKGIYYSSYAATGNVIKMFPAEVWGQTPETEGPTPAGEVICFGDLENDYPDFKPFEPLAKKDEIKVRSEENAKKAEAATSTITTLQNEKRYSGSFSPMLYLPMISAVSDYINDQELLGVGAMLLGYTSRTQMNPGIAYADAFYYYNLNNFSVDAGIEQPLGSNVLDVLFYRHLFENPVGTDYLFTETNNLSVGFTMPVINVTGWHYTTDLSFITAVSANYNRTAKNPNEICYINSDMNAKIYGEAQLGFEFYHSQINDSKIGNSYKLGVFGTTFYDIPNSKFYFGLEGDFDWRGKTSAIDYGMNIAVRYTKYPAEVIPGNSLVKIKGEHVDCTYPLVVVPQVYGKLNNFLSQGADLKVYAESSVKVDEHDVKIGNSDALGLYTFGVEGIMEMGRAYLACGYSFDWNFTDTFISNSFYFSCRMNWFRY